ALRYVETFGVELEVVDQRLHRALHLRPARRRDLVVIDHHRPSPLRLAQLADTLLHDAHRLAHFLHADAVAVVAVAVLADRNVEIHLRISLVRLRLAQIPRRPGTAHHHAREAPRPGISELHDTDVDIALLEDAVAGQQRLKIIANLQERIA